MHKKHRPTPEKRRSVPRRLVSIFLKGLLTIFIILVIVIFLVQTPYVQNIIRGKAEKYLSRKLNTQVGIGTLYIDFPNSILLKDIYLADRKKDTLLSAGLIHVNMRMWQLIHGNIDIDQLQLQDLTAKVTRTLPDTAFNFQFIIDAFAAKDKQEPVVKKDTSSLKMALRSVILDNIRLVYKDVVTGNDAEVWIGHSQTDMDIFDPSGQHFSITRFGVRGLKARIVQDQPLTTILSGPPSASAPIPSPATAPSSAPSSAPHEPVKGSAGGASRSQTSASQPLRLDIGKIDLESSDLEYRNTVNAFYTSMHLGQLSANVQRFDLDKQLGALKDLKMDSSTVLVHIGKTKSPSAGSPRGQGSPKGHPAPSASPDPTGPAADNSGGDSRFTAALIELNGNHIQFDNDDQPRQQTGVDYGHLDLTGLTLHSKDLSYSKDSIGGAITRGSFKDRSGFELDQLQVNFGYTGHQAFLRNLMLRTPGTLLQRNLILNYSSLAAIQKDPAHTYVDLDLSSSRVQIKDILQFAPSLRSQPAFAHPGDIWLVNTRIKGSMEALRVETLQFSGLQDLKIDLSGTLHHVMDTKRVAADLHIRNLSGSRRGLTALLPPNTLPSKISIPDRFTVKGRLNGSMDNVLTDLTILTSSGTVTLKGAVRQFRDTANASYDLTVQTRALDLAYILQDSKTWGLLTADFAAKGKGLTLASANATLDGKIISGIIKKYEYRDMLFSGSIADRRMALQSSIDNEAIRFALSAKANLSGKFPAVQLDWKIDTLDMHALHLMQDTLQFKGHILADFASTNPDSLKGNLKIAGISMVSGQQHFHTDSILLVAGRVGNMEDIRFQSEMADLDLSGTYKITEMAQALQQAVNSYYHIDGYKDSTFTPQQWDLKGTLRPSPLVLAYMPSLKGSDSVGFLVTLNSSEQDLHFLLNAPLIRSGNQTLRQVTAYASTGPDQLQYGVQLAGGIGSGFELHQTSLKGHLADNHLFSTVLLKDSKGKNRYQVAGQLDKLGDGLKFIMNPDSLLLDYDQWTVSRDNYILYDSAGLVVNNFKISNKGESLQINSNPPAATSPVDIAFTDFRLATLSRFADQDSLSVDGVLNGKAEIKNILSSPVFTSDLTIKGLTFKKDTVGDLAIKVNNEKANAFAADITLKGNQNDMEVKGEYYTGEGRVDMKLDLNSLNLASLKPFATSQVQDMKGFLKGSLVIKGTMDKPGINGKLHFDSTLITPLISGEPLKISNDNIEFDDDGFNFSKFSMQDSAGNKATIDGNVNTDNYRDFDVDLTFNASNFRLVNAPQTTSRIFYGKMNIDAAFNITGNPKDDLSADGNLRINKRTDFTFVLPENNPEVVEREGVVRFIDKDHPGDTTVNSAAIALKARNAKIKGMDVSLSIETDSSALFTIIIDERNGDALTARGRSNLVFGMDKSGKTDLTGGFEVESGAYNLSLDVLKRKFEIQHGSTITFTGDPTTATLDVTATYTANTPSIDLIENEIAGRTQTEINKFKQKLPFLVTLKMEGELLKPKITFDITLPTSTLALWPDVDQRLQQIRVQESELNKQVFALLLLNRFVGEDPLQSAAGGGTSLNSLAFQSASQILTNQLDQLAGSLIKGVDIHFDLNNQQDFSTGTEQDYTELNVSVSKRLFNDRITVNVGSNFDVQGAGNPNQQASNIAGDVAVDYKLTKDGRYALRAYRKNQYEAVVEGQVVETGVSFILTFDYDKFREIFGGTKEERLEERERRRSKPATGPGPAPPPANTNDKPASPDKPATKTTDRTITNN
ncbi:MAG TPA: translocation/assembly module TamB domain-containing protein [Puia sp.]|nr:translocation/assembly module TamB domain-containing protein [Puia sp.]